MNYISMEDIYSNFNQLNDDLIYDNLIKAEQWIKLTLEQGHEINDAEQTQVFINDKLAELDSFISNINVIFISQLTRKHDVLKLVKGLVVEGIKRDFEVQKEEVLDEVKELLQLK
ncbi:hypothetical protein Cantr_00775 [Candida viswanathii]|uniref:Uncharacterized protein n=1 Tax=Candida viswanathii TaxID=5486 RepID=A0A367YFZ8_9ASCO|nr:hypothetical protein Cantr_00775 [Candida viswanathii]